MMKIFDEMREMVGQKMEVVEQKMRYSVRDEE